MNQEIEILIGVSGSGKSTYSINRIKHNVKWVRVNRDDIRRQLIGELTQDYYKRKDLSSLEKQVTFILFSQMRHLLSQGFNIIVDNTNLKISVIGEFLQEFNHLVDIRLTYFGKDLTLKEIKERVKKREDKRSWWDKFLDFDVFSTSYIDKQWDDFKKLVALKTPDLYPKKDNKAIVDITLPKTIICDLDGTLSLFERGKKSPYDRDFENDTMSQPVLFVLKSWLKENPGGKITFFSGRDFKFLKQTREFLQKELEFRTYTLHMRDSKDSRNDASIKEDMYNKHIKGKYNVEFVLDDRLRVCRLWNKLGFFIFNVNQENIEF